MIRETLEQWCDTGELTPEMAIEIITEYLALDGKTATSEQLTALLQAGQMVPINWSRLAGQICIKNNWIFIEAFSAPNQFGQRELLHRYIY